MISNGNDWCGLKKGKLFTYIRKPYVTILVNYITSQKNNLNESSVRSPSTDAHTRYILLSGTLEPNCFMSIVANRNACNIRYLSTRYVHGLVESLLISFSGFHDVL